MQEKQARGSAGSDHDHEALHIEPVRVPAHKQSQGQRSARQAAHRLFQFARRRRLFIPGPPEFTFEA